MNDSLLTAMNTKLETVEDKVDKVLRVLAKIARRLASDDKDKAAIAAMTAELSDVATELETVVAATKPK